tara:strand:- start:674 stop:1000 length:327 start_codon:yes stop_codon:yes gene_type:complete
LLAILLGEWSLQQLPIGARVQDAQRGEQTTLLSVQNVYVYDACFTKKIKWRQRNAPGVRHVVFVATTLAAAAVKPKVAGACVTCTRGNLEHPNSQNSIAVGRYQSRGI